MTDQYQPTTAEPPDSATSIGDLLPCAVRCYIEPTKPKEPAKPSDPKAPRGPLKLHQGKARPSRMLVIDCETVTAETLAKTSLMPGFDPEAWPAYAQSLLFGSAHLYVRGAGGRKWSRTHEWMFYPDSLPPAVIAKLERRWRYDTRALGDWREPLNSPDVKAYCLPLSEFLKVLFREAVSKRCLVVGFNLPFDLSRLAARVGQAKSRRFVGGFSFVVWQNKDGKQDRFRPRLTVKALTVNAAGMAFASFGEHGSDKRGHSLAECLDLRQLVYGLTGDPHTLNTACEALGLSGRKAEPRYHGVVTLRYIRYNRQDVLLTAKLAFAALDLFDTHPVSRGYTPRGRLSEVQVFSPASFAKAYFRAMGVRPRLKAQPDFPKRALAAAMQAFSAARSETRIYKEPIPVAPLDFTSMFPTVTVLQRIWAITTAKTVEVRDSTQAVQNFLENVTAGKMFDPAVWTELNAFALILPQGDILPTRAIYSATRLDWKIGLAPYTSERPQWYALSDLVVSKIRTGRAPKVLEAFRLVPHGITQGLRPVRFAGAVTVDPTEDDFFRRIVEERARIRSGLPPYDGLSQLQKDASTQALKVISNAGAWGIHLEMHQVALPRRQTQTISLWLDQHDIRTVETHTPQEEGQFFFPPTASLVTAGARLMVALLQNEVESRGASYVTIDTDSLFATYHPDGGFVNVPGAAAPIRLLDPVELIAIRTKLNRLNPYNTAIVPFLVRHEHADRQPLYVYSIIAKRYTLFVPTAGDPDIVDRSESALGGLLPTTTDPDWIDKWWIDILSHRQLSMPNGPLVHKFSAHSWETLQHFKALNDGKDYQAQVKPFNFFVCASPSADYPDDPSSPMSPLVAPLDLHQDSWLKSTWYDTGTGEPTRIAIDMDDAMSGEKDHPVCVQTLCDYFAGYHRTHPSEFLPPPGGWSLGGMLRLRHVRQASLTLLGKEDVHFFELARAGLIQDDPLQLELHPNWVLPLLPILDDFPKEDLYSRLQVGPSALRHWITGETIPSDRFHQRLEEICLEHVDSQLKVLGIPTPENPANAFELYVSLIPKLKIGIAQALESIVKKEGVVAVGRRLSLNRRTVRHWIADPDAIPASRSAGDLAYHYPELIPNLAASLAAAHGGPTT